jgi:hypothetical protein
VAARPESDEARKGFLLNHLITEELPLPSPPGRGDGGEGNVLPSPPGRGAGGEGNVLPSPPGRGAGGEGRISNSDPITGQAGWYDVRVRIYKATDAGETTLPQFASQPAAPGTSAARRVIAYFAGGKK